MIICHQGQMELQGKKKIGKGFAAVMEQSSSADEIIKFKVSQAETRFLLLAGKPLNEPIAAQGPFVLNEREELFQAFEDYQQSKNGFEGAGSWESEIKNLRHKSRTK